MLQKLIDKLFELLCIAVIKTYNFIMERDNNDIEMPKYYEGYIDGYFGKKKKNYSNEEYTLGYDKGLYHRENLSKK